MENTQKVERKGDIYVFLEGYELEWDPTLRSPIQKLHCGKKLITVL
jgi:hypothetical protein